MKIGIEIECFLPLEVYKHINDEKKSYHSKVSDKQTGWRFESDGSLNSQGRSFTIELISPILASVAELKSSLGRLFFVRLGLTNSSPVVFTSRINENNNWSRSKNKMEQIEEYERKGTAYIGLNESCGCHIHFSRRGKETPNMPVERCQQIAADYLDWMKFAYPEASLLYERQYNRSYASKITKVSTALYERQSEFFYTSNEGIEWRAFNLAGATTVKEIIDRIVQAYSLIEKWANKSYKREEPIKSKGYTENYIDQTIELLSYFESNKHSYILRWDGYGFELDKQNVIQVKINKNRNRTALNLLNITNTDTVCTLRMDDLDNELTEIEIFEEV